jgi:DNA-binding MarR family transcriptional regulator
MERAGLVRRERDPVDRRSIRLRLTPRAMQLKNRLLPLAIDLNHSILAGLSRSEAEQFVRSLQRARTNLERLNAGTKRSRGTSIP